MDWDILIFWSVSRAVNIPLQSQIVLTDIIETTIEAVYCRNSQVIEKYINNLVLRS
jgi:hypothetical protein